VYGGRVVEVEQLVFAASFDAQHDAATQVLGPVRREAPPE
jgi:hypothetical protein